MRISCVFLLITGLAVAAMGGPRETRPDTLFQTSTIGGLIAGAYSGDMTFAELRRHGDFGLGTFDALNGEMVAVDGRFYQVLADGRVHRAPDSARTPFAAVKWFRADRTLTLPEAGSMQALEQFLDRAIPSKNVCTAIRIEGRFPRLTTRSVPRQEKPYAGLAEAVKQQKTFDLADVEGVMVGFRTPAYMAGLNVPGYHFHFLTADRTAGGHVLTCEVQQAHVQLDSALGLELVLPGTPEFAQAVLPGQSP